MASLRRCREINDGWMGSSLQVVGCKENMDELEGLYIPIVADAGAKVS